MQLIKCSNPSIKVAKGMAGLIEVEFEHTISSTKATALYAGPPIQPEVWHQILAFFDWTWTTTHSESQVRLFVNIQQGIWAAWAAPQEARTGMSAREIDSDEAKVQRRLFSDQEGWIYFGTVHHHCSAGAFQSGTDEWNEKTQDGLHITIGKMGSAQYDMHARFYVKEACFNPDMSFFWDVGRQVRELLPAKFYDEVARHQMCVRPPLTTEFPDFWKTNLIEIKTVGGYMGGENRGFFSQGAGNGGSYGGGSASYSPYVPEGEKLPGSWARDFKTRADLEVMPIWRRAKIASYQLMEYAARQGVPWEQLNKWILEQTHNDDLSQLISILVFCGVDLGDFWRDFPLAQPDGYEELRTKNTTEDGKKKRRKRVTVITGEPHKQVGDKPVSIPVKEEPKFDAHGNPQWDEDGGLGLIT